MDADVEEFMDIIREKITSPEEFELCKTMIQMVYQYPDKEVVLKYESGKPKLLFYAEEGQIKVVSFKDVTTRKQNEER